MSENSYTIHEYDHRFDAGLAVMWNESDDQWPGTFTDGVPLTEERVHDWMDRIEAIMRLIVVENETGKVVGYGDLWDSTVRPHSCYVALLNVQPAHQGRSLARRMLVHMVDWAVAHNYDRVTIGTWPANLKAMPLYKKVGFFWKPGTSVYMENYLPAVRLLPVAQSFFEKYDWYTTYDRELQQVEDDRKHPHTGDMEVYTLRWQDGEDFLETVFDRNAQALTGIETPDWAAYARTESREPAKGIRYPFEWELTNRKATAIPVTLKAVGEDGIHINQNEDLVLEPGETRLIQADFCVDLKAPDYPGHHDDAPTPRVRTWLQVNGTALELGTGLRYKDAFAASLYPEVVSLAPHHSRTVHLQVRNMTGKERSATLELELPDGLEADWAVRAFNAPADGFAGLPVTLTTRRPGFFLLKARIVFEDAGKQIRLEPADLPVTAPAPGKWVAGRSKDAVILENDFFRLTANEKAGEAVLWNKDTQREEARLMEEIGPAFVPWDLHEQEYDLSLQPGPDEARVIMTVRSTRFPGLVVGREIAAGASPLIKVRGWVANNTAESFEELVLRPHVRMAHEDDLTVTAPLNEGLVREHASQFGTTEEDHPKDPGRYSEEWIAYEDQGRAFGFIWPKGRVKELLNEFGRHFFILAPDALAPEETRWSPPLFLYSGPGDWRAVQQAWRRLSGETGEKITHPETARPYLDLGISPQPLVTLGEEIPAQLHAASTREYRLKGKIALQTPTGWQGDFEEQPFEIRCGRPMDHPLRFRPSRDLPVGVAKGELLFGSQAFDRAKGFALLRIGDSDKDVQVAQVEEAGQPVFHIANGHSRWAAAPAFHGGITSWRTDEGGPDQLLTSFPREGELGWMKPFFGGIRPVLHDPAGYGWPGKLHRERFFAAPVEAADALGMSWKGVRMETEMQAKPFRGLKVELEYLTLPGSNILQAVYRINNPAPVYRKVQYGWLTFMQVDGEYRAARLHTAAYSRNRTPQMSWGVHDSWAAVENPDTGRTLLVLHADREQRLQAIDMGAHGAHVFVRQTVDVPPGSVVEIAAFFVLADTLEQARMYAEAGLGGLRKAWNRK